MANELTFGGYPITLEKTSDDVLIHCKGLTGRLTQVDAFFKDSSCKRHYFGDSKIRKWRNHTIKIDCLVDTKANFKNLYKQVKEFKNG